MKIEEKVYELSDGRKVMLRSPEHKDAEDMIRFHIQVSGESDLLTNYPEEVKHTIESECAFFDNLNNSERDFMIAALCDGKIIGNISVSSISKGIKRRHRAELGISVINDFWGYGIGSKFMNMAIKQAKVNGFEQIELGVYATNERAVNLYKKFGFKETGRIPRAYHLKDGEYIYEIEMVRILK